MTRRRALVRWFTDRPARMRVLLLGPGLAWLTVFFAVPLALMLAYSVMPRGQYGGVRRGLTLEHYARLLDPLYLTILERSVLIAALSTAICLLLGFPLAWAIARSGRWKNLLLFLVVLPFWTSFLVRTYAMIFLLRDSGFINSTLMSLGVIDESLTLLYTPGAVILGTVYGFLPFMVLPVYASLEQLDPALLEAAEVLGARPLARLRRVLIPLALPGIVAGSLLVFVPALGAFLTPDLLGGAKEMMVGTLIQNQFTAARNWPFGSAVSFMLMVVVLVALTGYLRSRGREAV